MATFSAAIVAVSIKSVGGGPLPVADLSTAVRLGDLTTSGSSQNVKDSGGVDDWVAPDDVIVMMTCDGEVDIAAAAAPTAAATAGWRLQAAIPTPMSVRKGHKLAVIDR